MPSFKSLVGVLAISTALTGGAVALGTAVTTGAANATTVMGCGGGCGGGGWGRGHRNRNNNWNHNRVRQHERQHQFQRQHLLRDFTLLVTPFQKSDNDVITQQKQHDDSEAKAEAESPRMVVTKTPMAAVAPTV
ncbi:hypothetical protein GCM10023194_33130 [Planotetraspora phitsanulokensis]|uniref:Secreted protein n=1 Tax=Planotetraspora phitsanulokensis TaxID=575192 RepID=A0A8J3XDH0_9ACTN|nr:hypothetical protein [Planotetraspora phitsanulokensis]GII36559.1 hypothetical protein Pph01_15620 [Planotetraspora phitsanulokensis]